MKTLFLALLGICSIAGSSAVTCHACQWSLSSPTFQPECKEDTTIPTTADFTCATNSAGAAAIGCSKFKQMVNGVGVFFVRGCIYAETTGNTVARGKADKGCDHWGYEDGDDYTCYCYDEKCNGASAATFGIAMILLLLAAAHQMIHH